jgi:hypothetical protein
MAGSLLIDPKLRSITTIKIINNADIFRVVGGDFVSKRTPDNNLVHYLVEPDANECGFCIRGMHMPEDFIFSMSVITGSRPYQDSPYWNANFSYFNILNNVLFLTRTESNEYILTQPEKVVWSSK